MRIIIHRSFGKQYAKVPQQIQAKFRKRRDVFILDPFHALLNNHPLTGDRKGQWSFNITGDWRVVYELADSDTTVFLEIGTHDTLYRK